jgi:serine/threonine protein kinase
MKGERQQHEARRSARIRRVVEDCLQRRAAGEPLTNEQVLANHADLLPELEQELDLLSLMERAAERARGGSSSAEAIFAVGGGAVHPPRDALRGYEFVGEIHRGGQGVVYEAIQTTTRRRVAIKVMNRGPFGDRHGGARFEREVQILARLNHPNIVTIHETGRTSDSDFFVMDYIEGTPLDQWVSTVRERSLDWGDRRHPDRNAPGAPFTRSAVTEILALFVKVCHAVNAAHLRGVIHRDLKPSNVRVDSDGEPHVLDFGLAKLSADEIGRFDDDSDMQTMTLPGQFVGSLPWASPEQAEGSANIDLRTDVYSLGVLLYQMLTGTFPYEVEGNLHDVLGRIMQASPVRPRSLNARIGDEIETIILKCLAKDRERRYQSAGELARDVERYLAGEPIEAKRDSLNYVLAKQLRRYRFSVVVVCSFVVVLVAGFAASFVYWQEAARDRDAAEAARVAANDARHAEREQRERAETAAREAERESARADAVKAFLQQMLVAADPQQAKGRNVTVREVLDDAAARIDAGPLVGQPAAQAEVRETIARTYNHLGLYHSATPHYEWLHDACVRRFGESDRESVRMLSDLAKNYAQAEDYTAAEMAFERCLELAVAEHGDDPELMLAAMDGLGNVLAQMGRVEEAEPLYVELLDGVEQTFGREHELFVSTTFNLGIVFREQGRLEDAERSYVKALNLAEQLHGDDSFVTIRIRRYLAYDIYRQTERMAEAEELLRETLELARRGIGLEHTETNVILIGLSRVLRAREKSDEAEQLLRDAIAKFSEIRAIENNDTLKVVRELAHMLVARDDPEEAARVFGDGIRRAIQVHGDEHRMLADWIAEYSTILRRSGDFEAAIAAARQTLSIRRRLFGPAHTAVAHSFQQIGWTFEGMGDLAEAQRWYRQALDMWRELSGETHRETIRATITLTFAMLRTDEDGTAATDMLRQRYELVRAELGDTHRSTLWVAVYLSSLLSCAELHSEAIALDRAMLDILVAQQGEDALEIASWQRWLGLHLYNSGRAAEAIEPYRRALSIQRAHEKQATVGALETKRELAEALVVVSELEEAEMLARDALHAFREGTTRRSIHIPWTMIILSEALVGGGTFGEAESLLRECLAMLENWPMRAFYASALGGRARSLLGQCLAAQGRYDEAGPLLLEGYAMLSDVAPMRRIQTRAARTRIIRLYEAWGQPEKAAEWRAESPTTRPTAPSRNP